MKKQVRRGGFTLPEVLVTVTVVAVLAAVVVPAVTQYAGKGDSPSTKNDVNALVQSVTSFITDVRKYPGDFRQLSTQITTATTCAATGVCNDASAAAFSLGDSTKWHGPYSQATLDATSGFLTTTGYVVQLGPAITRTGTPNYYLQTSVNKINGTVPGTGNCKDVLAFDTAIDGPTTDGSEGNSGAVRFTTTCKSSATSGDPGTVTLRLMAAP